MLDFVRLLTRRYQTILSHTRDGAPIKLLDNDTLTSLVLSEAFLEKGELLERHPSLPVQIVVIGPTQVGKSSVVNVLLGDEYAGVSPLAGFTTRPQGFALGLQDSDCSVIHHFFQGYGSIRSAEGTTQYDIYSLRLISTPEHPTFRSCVVWDTPDFDSIDAADYSDNLLRTVALADLILLAVSKEKYADETVWNMLSLIESLKQPTVVFLNKVSPEHSRAVIQSFSEKWAHSRSDPMPSIVSAAFLNEGLSPKNSVREHDQLIDYLRQANLSVNRSAHRHQCAALLKSHWTSWTDAVRQEQKMVIEWHRLVEVAASGAIEIYERYYLNHPQHFETLKRALAELLTLLEVPGVAPLLMKTRQLLTWPVRYLLGLGRHESADSGNEAGTSQETQVLRRMLDHYLIHLSDAVLSKRTDYDGHEHWWNEISSLLKTEQPIFTESYNRAVRGYQTEFHHEIEAAAHRLYDKLKQQPATLNSLRATRVTTDAAAVAIALKTGGIGVQDFIITPAVLSLTSFLTESALGHYMRRVEAELKQRQLNAVRTQIFDSVLSQQLKSLPTRMVPNNKFNISEISLREAEAQLHEF